MRVCYIHNGHVRYPKNKELMTLYTKQRQELCIMQYSRVLWWKVIYHKG